MLDRDDYLLGGAASGGKRAGRFDPTPLRLRFETGAAGYFFSGVGDAGCVFSFVGICGVLGPSGAVIGRAGFGTVGGSPSRPGIRRSAFHGFLVRRAIGPSVAHQGAGSIRTKDGW